MFVNEGFNSYKYLVSVSDNYVVLTNKRNVTADWQNPTTYSVIYQYFDPSYITIEETKTTSSNLSFTEVDISNDFWDRPDCSELVVAIFVIVLLLITVINTITEFIQRGGLIKW